MISEHIVFKIRVREMCGRKRYFTANNRESPRIAFYLRCLLDLVVSLLGRVPTLRLIGSAWPERQRGKCWKTRVAGFLFSIRNIRIIHAKVHENTFSIIQIKRYLLSGENPQRGFSSIFRSAVTATRSRSGVA